MVADCNVESILQTERNENKEEIQISNRLEVIIGSVLGSCIVIIQKQLNKLLLFKGT